MYDRKSSARGNQLQFNPNDQSTALNNNVQRGLYETYRDHIRSNFETMAMDSSSNEIKKFLATSNDAASGEKENNMATDLLFPENDWLRVPTRGSSSYQPIASHNPAEYYEKRKLFENMKISIATRPFVI